MKLNKKSLVLLVCVALLLTFAVSGTVAFLADNSGPVVNEFTPTEVDTEIEEPGFEETNVKSTIQIRNVAGDNHIPVYVRVAVVGNWYNAEGQIVGLWEDSVTVKETADTVDNNGIANGKWFAADGYYYFSVPVQPGETTTNLLGTPISETKKENGDYLVITVVHQSIQSQPTSVVATEWGVSVAADGTISK